MPPETTSKPSFSPWRKWGTALHVGFIILLVLSVMVMANYLSREYPGRFYLSASTRNSLSPHSIKFLQSLTNEVKVTLYYDKEAKLYSTVADLLKEYRQANHKITLQEVDYIRDPAAAQKVATDYKRELGATLERNLIIFDCQGRIKIIPGDDLVQSTLEQTGNKEAPFRRKLVAFQGEKAFTATLIAVTNLKPLKAYFLTGHGEHRIDSGDEVNGYMEFASVVRQDYVQVEPLILLGAAAVPEDCNLLVIAGPTTALLPTEVQMIEQYLDEGGHRLMVLFNSESIGRETGLERLLATRWGVGVGSRVVVEDAQHTTPGKDIVVSAFSKNEIVYPLVNYGIAMVQPRAISKQSQRTEAADAPRVEVIASTGDNACLAGDPAIQPQRIPLMVAVEKGAIKDVTTERGTTRMLIVGDSFCLANRLLNSTSFVNRDFAHNAINWLLDRPQLVAGVGPRPVNQYRLVMTKAQLQSTRWVLLAGMPSAALLLGGLVWLRRRN